MEHRWGQRVPLEAALWLSGPVECAGRLRDLSASGAWVDAQQVLPVNSLLVVELLPASADGRDALRIPAAVARVAPGGMGLEWCEFAPDEVVALVEQAQASRSPAVAGDRLAHTQAQAGQRVA